MSAELVVRLPLRVRRIGRRHYLWDANGNPVAAESAGGHPAALVELAMLANAAGVLREAQARASEQLAAAVVAELTTALVQRIARQGESLAALLTPPDPAVPGEEGR